MLPVFKEGRHAAEFILTEANGQRSRENVVIPDSSVIVAGQVMANVTTLEGAVLPICIAIYPMVTGSADGAMAVIARDAEVNGKILTWPAGANTTGEFTTDIAALRTAGIIVRGFDVRAAIVATNP